MTDKRDKVSIPETGREVSDSHSEEEKLLDRCAGDREDMSPRETADCAGADLAELYDVEESGGS